jgi:DNA-binding LytR/AlgR family response regulator
MNKINALIIDDEQAAIDVVKLLCEQLADDIEIVGVARDGIEALKLIVDIKPELIFLDVDMPNLNGIEVLNKLQLKNVNIIFTTGHEQHAFKAIKFQAVDFLLKPIDPADFVIAVEKVRQKINSERSKEERKKRFLVKKGTENIILKAEDIALIYTENKVTYVFDRTGKKFLIDKTMTDLESELEADIFFRANRQYIINLNYVKFFKSYEKVKLQVELDIPQVNHFIIISQKSAPDFRSWVVNL